MSTISDVKDFVVKFVKEVATLKRPVTAVAVATTILGVLLPLGIDGSVTDFAAILTGVGVVAAAVEQVVGVLGAK